MRKSVVGPARTSGLPYPYSLHGRLREEMLKFRAESQNHSQEVGLVIWSTYFNLIQATQGTTRGNLISLKAIPAPPPPPRNALLKFSVRWHLVSSLRKLWQTTLETIIYWHLSSNGSRYNMEHWSPQKEVTVNTRSTCLKRNWWYRLVQILSFFRPNFLWDCQVEA